MLRGNNPHALYAPIIHLLCYQQMPIGFNAFPLGRHVPQQAEDQTTHRIPGAARQIDTRELVRLSDYQPRTDHELAVAKVDNGWLLNIELIDYLPNQLLYKVLQRDKSRSPPILIYNYRKMELLLVCHRGTRVAEVEGWSV